MGFHFSSVDFEAKICKMAQKAITGRKKWDNCSHLGKKQGNGRIDEKDVPDSKPAVEAEWSGLND